MAKLKVMRKTVKSRYAADGRDYCTGCNQTLETGDEYTAASRRSDGTKRLLYCRACAEEKNII